MIVDNQTALSWAVSSVVLTMLASSLLLVTASTLAVSYKRQRACDCIVLLFIISLTSITKMAQLASFKIPTIRNEPMVSWTKWRGVIVCWRASSSRQLGWARSPFSWPQHSDSSLRGHLPHVTNSANSSALTLPALRTARVSRLLSRRCRRRAPSRSHASSTARR